MSEPLPSVEEEANAEALDRVSERQSLFLNAEMSVDGRGGTQARVRNLSAGGMMVELERAPDPEWAPGDPVAADLRNIGLVRGEIAWAGGRRFGVRFDREIDPELVRKPVTYGKELTPNYLKAIRVPERSLKKLTEAMKR